MRAMDQSANLTGMLSQIAGTLGDGIKINGMNAGQAMGENIRNAVAPTPNNNDPASLREYAQWLQNNGNREEAARYRAKADTLEQSKMAMQRATQFDGLFGQATAASQQGDVSALTQRITQLQSIKAQATTPEEQRALTQQIRALQGDLPNAQKRGQQRKGASLVSIEAALQQEGLDPRAKAALEQRLGTIRNEVMNDPTAFDAYRDVKNQQFQAEKAEREAAAQAWVEENKPALINAVAADDADTVDKLLATAGPNAEAAMALINKLYVNKTYMDSMRTAAAERNTGYDFAVYDDMLSTLPADARKTMEGDVSALRKFQKANYDDNGGTWTQGARVRADQLAKRIESKYNALSVQMAQMEYSRSVRTTEDNAEAIKQLELDLLAPVSNADVMRRANEMKPLDRKGRQQPLTQEDIAAAAAAIRTERNESIQNQIDALRGGTRSSEEASEGPSVVDKGKMALRNGVSRDVIRQRMLDEGATEEDIVAVLGQPRGSANVTLDMPTPEQARVADQRRVEQIRSGVSPMGERTASLRSSLNVTPLQERNSGR